MLGSGRSSVRIAQCDVGPPKMEVPVARRHAEGGLVPERKRERAKKRKRNIKRKITINNNINNTLQKKTGRELQT